MPATSNEQRRATRYHVKWRAAYIVTSPSATCFGYIKDISVTGALFLSEKTLPKVNMVELHIEIPANGALKTCVLIIKSRAVYSVFDNAEHVFRYGLEFCEYSQNSEKGFLEAYLHKFQQPVFVTNNTITI